MRVLLRSSPANVFFVFPLLFLSAPPSAFFFRRRAAMKFRMGWQFCLAVAGPFAGKRARVRNENPHFRIPLATGHLTTMAARRKIRRTGQKRGRRKGRGKLITLMRKRACGAGEWNGGQWVTTGIRALPKFTRRPPFLAQGRRATPSAWSGGRIPFALLRK